jgi:hypothetical protein
LESALFIFYSLILLSTPPEQKAAGWKGKIEIKDGAKAVINPTEPHFGEIKLELEEDLSIGTEPDEDYLFYRIKDIQVDGVGNIYVLDSGNNRVQVFNSQGMYLRTIGKEGRGPGELNAPNRLQADETGNIYVTDRSRKIVVFDKAGRHIDKDIHLLDYLLDFYLDSDKCVWGKFFSPGTETHLIRKLTPAGRIEKTLAEIPYYANRVMFPVSKVNNTASAFGYFFAHGYEHDIYVSKLNHHTFVYGYSKEYEFVAVNETGEILFTVRKQEIPKQITKMEKERITNLTRRDLERHGRSVPEISIEFPTQMPFYYSIITDDQTRIYVRTNPSDRQPNLNHEYDLFNKDGFYLYKMRSNIYPDVIKSGHLYSRIEAADSRMEQIKRYKIKNWNQIKSGI